MSDVIKLNRLRNLPDLLKDAEPFELLELIIAIFQKWESRNPELAKVMKLSQFTRSDGHISSFSLLSPEEAEFLKNYRDAGEEGQKVIRQEALRLRNTRTEDDGVAG